MIQTGKKPSQTGLSRFCPKKPSQAGLNHFCPKRLNETGFGFLKKKIQFDYFFNKNQTEPKMITPTQNLAVVTKI
jgi:hypothetical protein